MKFRIVRDMNNKCKLQKRTFGIWHRAIATEYVIKVSILACTVFVPCATYGVKTENAWIGVPFFVLSFLSVFFTAAVSIGLFFDNLGSHDFYDNGCDDFKSCLQQKLYYEHGQVVTDEHEQEERKAVMEIMSELGG